MTYSERVRRQTIVSFDSQVMILEIWKIIDISQNFSQRAFYIMTLQWIQDQTAKVQKTGTVSGFVYFSFASGTDFLWFQMLTETE